MPGLPGKTDGPAALPTGQSAASARSARRLPRLAVVFAVVAAALAAVWAAGRFGSSAFDPLGLSRPRGDLLFHKVGLENLSLTVVERGTLESADNRDIVCKVKSGARGSTFATTIRRIVEDGASVRKDQVVVELDSSGLEDQRRVEQITLNQARAALVGAEQGYKIVLSQNSSDTETARSTLQLAKIDLDKYLNGEYKQAFDDVSGRVELAKSDLRQWEDRVRWSERMTRRDYISQSQAESDRNRLQSAQLALKKVETERDILSNFVRKRTTTDLQAKVDEAERSLARVSEQAMAKEKQADVELSTKKLIYDQELEKLADIDQQIGYCTVRSPHDGMVVYYQSEQSRFGGGSQQSIVAEGEPVRQDQKLMRIPDLNRMLVNTRVHESMVSRVRGEVRKLTYFSDQVRAAMMLMPDPRSWTLGQLAFTEHYRDELRELDSELESEGQGASVRVDAYPNTEMTGRIRSVAAVASQADFFSADVKVYQTMVAIDKTLEGLKPGMSAEVTLYIENAVERVPCVPVTAVVGGAEMGQKRRVYVRTGSGGVEDRPVDLGASNERLVEVKAGVVEGDEVVTNPRVIVGDAAKTRDGNAGGQRGGRGDGKGGGEGKNGGGDSKGGGRRGNGEGRSGPPGGGGGSGAGGGPRAAG